MVINIPKLIRTSAAMHIIRMHIIRMYTIRMYIIIELQHAYRNMHIACRPILSAKINKCSAD